MRSLLRTIFWNNDPWLRWLLWACFANGFYQFTPWANTPWSVLPAMAIVFFNGVHLLRNVRTIRREKEAHKALERDGGYWAAEMAKQLIELELAEQRFATQAEKDEIISQLEEAKNRCAREIAIYERKVR